MNEHVLWTEEFRPKTIEECVLPDRLKQILLGFVESGECPNLLLTGSAGIGKTTVARAIAYQLKLDFIEINGSMRGDIGTLRTEIHQFASSVSLLGNRKLVILDEADYLNQHSTQPALRNFMEEFARNCSFFLTCNYPKKIIEPLRSRCSVVEFAVRSNEMVEMGNRFTDRLISILDSHDVSYDREAVVELVVQHMPDWRRILNETQRYSVRGSIDKGILSSVDPTSFEHLLKLITSEDRAALRRWVRENETFEPSQIFSAIYDLVPRLTQHLKTSDEIIHTLANYQLGAEMDIDQRINTHSCLVKVMELANSKKEAA